MTSHASRDTGAVAARMTSSRMIGRTAELAELEAALTDAAAGRPSLVFVAGESGVGKTRLLDEAARRAKPAGGRLLSGDCVELGEGELPYAPIVGALRPLARDGDPALDALPTAPAPSWRASSPGSACPRCHRSRPRTSVPLRAASSSAPLPARAARRRARRRAGDRGPALGRPLDARLPHLPGAQPVPRARAGRRRLPPRRAAPPPPAAAAAGRARARASARAGSRSPR